MLTRCYADNYRCLGTEPLRFEPLSVLLGPNGSGKSTWFDLIARLRDFILGKDTSLNLFPKASLTRWDTRNEQTFELGVRLEQGEYVYRLRISHRREQGINMVIEETLKLEGQPLLESTPERMTLYNDRPGGGVPFQPDYHLSGMPRVHERHDNTKLIAFRRFLESVLVLAPNPGLVEAVSKEQQPVTTPKPDCANFAGWLKHINNAEPLIREEAVRSLAQGSVPGFRAFQIDSLDDTSLVQCIFEGGPPRLKYRLDELSSGQIALVVLEVALAVVNERRGVLLLDEPGNFLGLSEVQPLLTRLQDAALEGRHQVILTAHHPIAINLLAAAHGLWLEREPSGPTRIQRIQVADDVAQGTAGIRISELVARGWLAGLGVQAAPEADGHGAEQAGNLAGQH